ncbi:MAG TPA: beta-galactosidase [Tessaracoccus flavescens]|uniref:Beta-galactosidase n=1 Tax=Tessaracoccus flavescens TaxID=399497 RepID=A0A921ER81_9ACTN|nr:beta-galactosidase [Tessaracoccus flavescens]
MIEQKGLLYGGDYNPEQWPREVWDEDINLMAEAGVNIVTLGVFSWATIQPSEDAWRTEWLHDIVDKLAGAGIAVDMATPSASPPPWLGLAEPTVRATTREGIRYSHGSRNHFCPSAPAYRDRAREVARRLGAEFDTYPNVAMWHVGNEYGQYCFCEMCGAAFRGWLQKRYESIAALNDAWGTAFWSQRYSAWAEVDLPRVAPYLINPAQYIDHRRFASDLLLDCYLDQRDSLRPLVGDRPITTNFMGFFDLVDYKSWEAHVDVVADDHYGDPADSQQPHHTALVHDLMRSLGHKPWLMMEQAMGAVNFRHFNTPKTDAHRRRDVLRAVAHGADGVLSFQWRQSKSGSERFHSAMLTNAGPGTRLHQEVRKLGADLRALGQLQGEHRRGDIALIFDWESMWAAEEPSVPDRRLRVLERVQEWYRPFWEAGFLVDVVSSTEDLSGYHLVVAPSQHLLRPEALGQFRAVVERGDQLVLGPFSGVVDEHTALLPGPTPAGLTDLLGAEVHQWWPLPEGGVEISSDRHGSFHVGGWAEQLSVGDAVVLATYEHSDLGPAVVSSEGLTYLSCDPPAEVLASILLDCAQKAGLAPDLGPISSTRGAEILRRGPLTFAFNNSETPLQLELVNPVVDLLTNQPASGSYQLAAGASAVLREESR